MSAAPTRPSTWGAVLLAAGAAAFGLLFAVMRGDLHSHTAQRLHLGPAGMIVATAVAVAAMLAGGCLAWRTWRR